MNNLYGKAMSEYLPNGGFKRVKANNESVSRVLKKSSNSSHDYFLEVNLGYPEELHDKHNDLPMTPEEIKATEEMLSPIQLKLKNNYDIKVDEINK